jgi:hypothetical protein
MALVFSQNIFSLEELPKYKMENLLNQIKVSYRYMQILNNGEIFQQEDLEKQLNYMHVLM